MAARSPQRAFSCCLLALLTCSYVFLCIAPLALAPWASLIATAVLISIPAPRVSRLTAFAQTERHELSF